MTPSKNLAVRGILVSHGKLFLVQRLDGRWEFAGGKTDGENPNYALRREFEEETNLRIAYMDYYSTTKQGKRHTAYYKVKARGNIKLQKSELKAYKYVSKSQALKMKITPETRGVIKTLW